jgi:hypothetical protein
VLALQRITKALQSFADLGETRPFPLQVTPLLRDGLRLLFELLGKLLRLLLTLIDGKLALCHRRFALLQLLALRFGFALIPLELGLIIDEPGLLLRQRLPLHIEVLVVAGGLARVLLLPGAELTELLLDVTDQYT